jgi:hypothetical protein
VLTSAWREPSPRYSSPIAPPNQVVWSGIPGDFATDIIEGVETEALAVPDCVPSGRLIFYRGAYGEIGSNRVTFAFLGRAISRILFRDLTALDEIAVAVEALLP